MRGQPRPIVEGFGALPHVTAGAVADYLKAHKAPPDTAEVLIVDDGRAMVYVRWPNGCIRWQTASSYVAAAGPVPDRGILQATSVVAVGQLCRGCGCEISAASSREADRPAFDACPACGLDVLVPKTVIKAGLA